MTRWNLGAGAVLVGLALMAGLMLYVRLAPSDPARWHVDPETTPDPSTPNFARLDRVLSDPPDTVAARLAAVTAGEGAIRLAGDDAHATWLTRSRLMGYPDYVSIRLVPDDGGTRVTALARARFGHSDMGANDARLRRWLAAMQSG